MNAVLSPPKKRVLQEPDGLKDLTLLSLPPGQIQETIKCVFCTETLNTMKGSYHDRFAYV